MDKHIFVFLAILAIPYSNAQTDCITEYGWRSKVINTPAGAGAVTIFNDSATIEIKVQYTTGPKRIRTFFFKKVVSE